MFQSSVACDLAYTNYHVVAEGFGGKGFLLQDEKDIDLVLRDAKRALAAGHSVLVNCMIGKSSFREGSISV